MEVTTLEQLEQQIQVNSEQNKTTIVKLHATWCQPCKNMSKWLATQKLPENVSVVEVDIDMDDDIANHFHVSSIPCTMKFDKSLEPVDKMIGFEQAKATKFFEIL